MEGESVKGERPIQGGWAGWREGCEEGTPTHRAREGGTALGPGLEGASGGGHRRRPATPRPTAPIQEAAGGGHAVLVPLSLSLLRLGLLMPKRSGDTGGKDPGRTLQDAPRRVGNAGAGGVQAALEGKSSQLS